MANFALLAIVLSPSLGCSFAVIQKPPAGLALAANGGISGLGDPGSEPLPASGPLGAQGSRPCRTPFEVVIEGTGPAPQLQQFNNSLGWKATDPANPTSLRRGPQRLPFRGGLRDNQAWRERGDRFRPSRVTPVRPGRRRGQW